MTAVKQVPSLVKELADAEKAVTKEIEEVGAMRGMKQKAILEIRSEIVDLSVSVAEKILSEQISRDNKQLEVIDKLIDEVKLYKS